jgi:hypothetical protein
VIGATDAVQEGFPPETRLKHRKEGYMGGQLTVTDLSTPHESGAE